jgi:hypothetical protein
MWCFDPFTNMWTPLSRPSHLRTGATLLPFENGRLVLLGGHNVSNIGIEVVEEYDVVTNKWRGSDIRAPPNIRQAVMVGIPAQVCKL